MDDCRAREDTHEAMADNLKLYQSWIGDANEMCGSRIQIAKRDLDNGKTVFEYAVNEIFDPSTDEKLLRFFRTEDIEEEFSYSWVAVPRDGAVDECTLFAAVGDDEHRLNMEDYVRTYCHPLTMGQKCADWFLMKTLISGTVAGKIYAEVERVTDEMLIANDELMHNLLKKCMESWFKRHKSSSAMTMGTENEEPTFDALKEEPCVRYLYEVGLLQCITNPVLGVSPDGMVMMNGDAPYNGQIGCVEIKTRVKATRIARAEAAQRECGRVVGARLMMIYFLYVFQKRIESKYSTKLPSQIHRLVCL